MKLAEALALRAEANRRIEQLRGRIVANARYQKGEEPSEDASARLGAGTITDAIARRDVLKIRHSLITAAADAAAARRDGGWAQCCLACGAGGLGLWPTTPDRAGLWPTAPEQPGHIPGQECLVS